MPDTVETEWQILAIRCTLCRSAAFTPTEAAAEAFLAHHQEHSNRLEYVGKLLAPPEMAGMVCTLTFGPAAQGPG